MKRREFLVGSAAAAILSQLSQDANALTHRQLTTLLGTVGWINPGSPGVDLDLANGRYAGGALSSLLSNSNSTGGYVTNSDGSMNLVAANTIRRGIGTGVLSEAGATNLALQSSNVANAAWSAIAGGSGTISRTANSAAAPDGTTTAALVTINRSATSDSALFYQQFTGTAAAYTNSIYFMAATPGDVGKTFVVTLYNGTSVVGTLVVTLTAVWQRYVLTATLAASASCLLRIGYLGGVATGTGSTSFYAWGDMLELGSNASSYYPSLATAGVRSADNITASGALATLLTASQGSVGIATNSSLAATTGTLLDANGSIFLGKTSSDTLTDNISAGLTTANTAVWTGLTKSFISWSASGRSLSLNNGTAATDATAMTPSATVHLGSLGGSSAFLNGYITRLTVWGSVVSASFFNLTGIQYAPTFDWGDSLTAGNQDGSGVTYPNALSALYSPTRTENNKGVSGDTSSQILTRFQALTSSYNFATTIWAGRNNYSSSAQVQSDIAAMVAALTTQEYLVLSIINGEYSNEWSGQSGYNQIIALNAALASTYGSHYLDVRAMLVAAYNPANPVDVIDHANDVPPFTLRAVDFAGTIVGAIGASDTTFTTSAAVGLSSILTVGSEYILITGVTGGMSVTSCTRGYAGTTASAYGAGQAYVGTDPLHLGAAGYRLIARWVKAARASLGGW